MLTAVLFDLDGTLLDSDMDVFMPHYFRALAAKLAPIAAPQRLIDALLASTRTMMQRTDRAVTNEQAFWVDFERLLGVARPVLTPLLDEFYRQDFPRLQRYTAPKPDARPLVSAAFAAGLTVVIATQPLFPLAAIRHRLAWANVQDFPFALVTSYENMHSVKPDPAYYAEICRRIGHAPAACLMVGNDPDADIRPAATAGLHTFWLADQGQLPIADLPAGHTGTLGDALRLLQRGALE